MTAIKIIKKIPEDVKKKILLKGIKYKTTFVEKKTETCYEKCYKTSNNKKNNIRKIKTKYYKRFRPKTPHGRTDRQSLVKDKLCQGEKKTQKHTQTKNKIKILIKVIKIIKKTQGKTKRKK